MQKSPLNYRTALAFSIGISLLLNLLFLIMFFYGKDAVMPSEGERIRPSLNAWNMLMHVIANFLLVFTLYVLNFKLLKIRFNSTVKLLTIILATFVCTWVLSYVFSNIQLQFKDLPTNSKHIIRGGMVRDSFIAIIVLFSSQLLNLWYKQQLTALENKSLLAENMKTRFAALKNQVDPHFLFNSLNTLNSLIKINTEKAQEYVQQLSYVFRYTLQNKETITLSEELKFTQSYCSLMQIRYGESLRFIHQIDAKYYDYAIIPLSLQILVENAIKHNVVSNKQPLSITISTSEDLYISVSNPIQLKKIPETGERIGLDNLAERYRLMWQKEICVYETEGVFEVKIPLIRL